MKKRTTTQQRKSTSTRTARIRASILRAIPIHCAHSKMVSLAQLKPHPKNPNRHDQTQVDLLAKIIQHQGWRSPITVSERSGFIVAGHARRLAAAKLGLAKVPVDYQSFRNEAEELAHLAGDNRIAELAEMDSVDLAELLKDLDGKIDLEVAGFWTDPIELPSLSEPPASVKDTAAEMAAINAQRRKGNKAIIEKMDTEFYLVIVFPNRDAKMGVLRSLKLPEDERYILADSVRIFSGSSRRTAGLPKSAPKNKAGACG